MFIYSDDPTYLMSIAAELMPDGFERIGKKEHDSRGDFENFKLSEPIDPGELQTRLQVLI